MRSGRTKKIMGPAAGLLSAWLSCWLGIAAASTLAFNQTAQLRDTKLPAAGEQHTLLTVSGFGRYAVIAVSGQGTALQLVDRMAGPGPITGQAGTQDGRLEAFLDEGEYKIVSYGHERATGQVELRAYPFKELNGPEPPLLLEFKPVQAVLADLQQRSYWIEIKQRRRVVLEAAGRSLGDMRLWRDGNWLVEATPEISLIEPVVGQGLNRCRLTADLNPGLYLLTLYGAAPQAWAQDSDQQPLYLRYGIPALPQAARQHFTVSPFGEDRWLVPGGADYYRMELAEPKPAALGVTGYQASSPFDEPSWQGINQAAAKPAVIETSTRPEPAASPAAAAVQSLVAEVRGAGRGEGYNIVSVRAAAGTPYVLQHFSSSHGIDVGTSGDYWLGTVQAGDAADAAPLTSIITYRPAFNTRAQVVDARAIELRDNTVWRRRFNLLEPVTLYLHAPQGGEFRVMGDGLGAQARFRIEPFLIEQPKDYQAPPLQGSGYVWALDAGYHVLTVQPKLKGIVDLRIEPQPAQGAAAAAELSAAADPPSSYHGLRLESSGDYRIYIGEQAGVESGVILRPLPLDVAAALPVSQPPGATLSLPIKVAEAGILRATTAAGDDVDIAIGDAPARPAPLTQAGEHKLVVRNPGAKTLRYSLQFTPQRLQSTTPLPALSGAALAARPKFDVLTAWRERFLRLDREQAATFTVQVQAPALYRLESTGLLHTEGNLRTRTTTSLMRQNSNGIGRNFLIQQYLREGQYQLTVRPQEQSRGHLGVRLAKTAVQAGGKLAQGIAARATLPAGQALSYPFVVERPGRYRLRVLGMGRTYDIRLEDDAGWPLIAPNHPGDVTRPFDAGAYRVIINPQAADARVLTLLERLDEAPKYSGHGPHDIKLEQTVRHEWLEPAAGAARTPDQWDFALPAKADVEIRLSEEITGELLRLRDAERGERVGQLPPGRIWQDALEQGRYRLAMRALRKNNRLPYEFSVRTQQLVVGGRREVTTPENIAIAVGQDRLIELSSLSSADVKASLYDAQNKRLAQNDDRDDDWNFLLARKLAPGAYRLHVESVDGAPAQLQVAMDAPQEITEPAMSLPASATLQDAALHTYPLTVPDAASLLVVTAASTDSAGISVEQRTVAGWRELGTSVARPARLMVPLPARAQGATAYRLRVWSVDRRGAPISLQAAALALAPVPESRLIKGGVALTALPGTAADMGVARIELARPGVFGLPAADDVVFWSAETDTVLRPARNGIMAVTGKVLWLAAALPKDRKAQRIQAQRISLTPAHGALQFDVPNRQPTPVDLAVAGGGPLLAVAQSRAGWPGLALVQRPAATAMAAWSRGMAPAADSVAAVQLAPGPDVQAMVWNAAALNEPLEMTLYQQAFEPPEVKAMAWGVQDLQLAARQALAFTLPTGPKQVKLVLPAGSAAVFSAGGAVSSNHWSGRRVRQETVATTADRLTLLHSGRRPARFHVQVHPVADLARRDPTLRPGGLVERNLATRGALRVPVQVAGKPLGPFVLRVRGDVEAVLVQEDGTLQRGLDMPLTRDGVLILEHGPGLILAWLEQAELGDASPWVAAPAEQTDVELPATVALRGASHRLRWVAPSARMLHLRSATPLISRLGYPKQAERVAAHPDGMALDVYVPAGESYIGLHAIGAGSLTGHVQLSTTPAQRIGEGPGPESVLDSGGARLYRFEVTRHGAIGIGVRASSDVVYSVLLDAQGRHLGTGVVQMPQLAPGTYYLAVHAPQASEPIRIQPVLVGVQPPDTGPPPAVIRRYLEAAGVRQEGGGEQP